VWGGNDDSLGGGAEAAAIWNLTCLSSFILRLWLSWSVPRLGLMDKGQALESLSSTKLPLQSHAFDRVRILGQNISGEQGASSFIASLSQ